MKNNAESAAYYKYLNPLRDAVKERFGRAISSVKDFENLSEEVKISVQTLRRFFGKIDSDKKLGETSLNVIAQYAGYVSWERFCKQIENQENNPQDEKWELLTTFFDTIDFSGVSLFNKSVFDTYQKYTQIIIENDGYTQAFLERYKGNLQILQKFLPTFPYYDKLASPRYIANMERYLSMDFTPHIQVSMNCFLALGAFLSGEDARFRIYFQKAKIYAEEMRKEVQVAIWPEIRFAVARVINAYLNNDVREYDTIIKETIDATERIIADGRCKTDDRELLYPNLCDIFIWIENIDYANKVYNMYKQGEFYPLGAFTKISKTYVESINRRGFSMAVFKLLECLNGDKSSSISHQEAEKWWNEENYNRLKLLKIEFLNTKTAKDKKRIQSELNTLYKKLNFKRFL